MDLLLTYELHYSFTIKKWQCLQSNYSSCSIFTTYFKENFPLYIGFFVFATARILEICAMLRKTKVYVKAMICKVFPIFKASMTASTFCLFKQKYHSQTGHGAGQQVGEFLLLPWESDCNWRGGGPATRTCNLSLSVNISVVVPPTPPLVTLSQL